MKGMRLQKALRWLATLAASTLLAWPATVLACPACNEAVSGDPVAAAFSVTTLGLIAMPFLLIGSIGGWVSYLYWRAGQRAPVPTTTHPADAAWAPIWTGEESRP